MKFLYVVYVSHYMSRAQSTELLHLRIDSTELGSVRLVRYILTKTDRFELFRYITNV
jgi:hypothetical protein